MKYFIFALLLFPLSASAVLKLEQSGKDKNYLYEQDSKALASNLQFVFRTGSLADPTGKAGLTSVAFESLLRGTQNKERKDFFAAMERLGAAVSVNTASNRTIISLDVVSENMQEAIKLLAEAILQPSLKDSEIKSLLNEKLATTNQELSNNRAILRRVLRQALFQNTPLAFPPEGNIDGLNSITATDVQAFLANHIKSQNVVIAVTSNHSAQKIQAWIESAFLAFPEGPASSQPTPTLTAPKGRTLYIVERKGSSTTEVALGQLGIAADRKDRDVLETGLFILGGDMSSRLFQTLRAKNGWTYGAYAGFQMLETPRRYGGSFMIYTFPHAEFTEKATLAALEIYADYTKKGVTAKELDFAKKSLGNSYPFKFATSKARLTARLYEHLDGAPVLSVPQYRTVLKNISQTKLSQSVQALHDPENVVIVAVGDPEKTESLKNIPGIKKVIKVTDPMKAF